ncbi:protein phosphatase 2C domain-containing protein [Barnesiella sp. ET7]|uniref:protein phosphatase 2C domain-containing protein n=1 Tax=Barnesiella sp. ET7 TaxID=2972460 RepID=UPI0021ACE1C5|nr:protein phosphatase 2C domain-containing protein [Barnesiella sp. ET7]MCR8912855.1 protein phosphatase 2C domain-containing protein [Barnesiella sp. ET7]
MKKIGLIISLLFLSITYSYAQKTLEEEILVEHYGAIRKEMVLKACHYCKYNDQKTLKLITSQSVEKFKDAIKNIDNLYNTVCSSSKQLYGSNINEYNNKLIASDTTFMNNLLWVCKDEPKNIKDAIKNDYKVFLMQIDALTEECLAFNHDNDNYLEQYPNGRFVILLKSEAPAENNPPKDPSNGSRKTPEEEIKELKNQNKALEKQNAELKEEIAELKGKNPDNNEGFSYSWIIILIILMLLGAYVYHLHKKGNKILSKFILLLPRRSNVNNQTTTRKPSPEPILSPTPKPNPIPNPNPVPQPVPEPRPQLQTEKFAIENNEWIIVGASVIGRGHIESNMPCQDSNSYASLGNGWGIAITSDGAGSAKHSHVGSKIVVTRAKSYFEQLILASSWYKNNILPDDITWSKAAFKALKAVRDDMQKFAEEKQAKLESFAATVIVVVHTPLGLLVAHIGDGRAGYQDKSGAWHSLITPHKGEEANQTIFITSDFWNIPFYEMSGVSVPETRVIRESAKSFVLMSDGCEHTSWDCNLYNADKGIYYDPNTPHVAFFNPLIETLKEHKKEQLPFTDRSEKWSNYLDKGNKSFIKETDDKTMILGTIS